MDTKINIAENHSVDLNVFEKRDVVVRDISFFNVFWSIFLAIIALSFLITLIVCKKDVALLIVCPLFIMIGSTSSIFLIIHMLTFKIQVKENNICYGHFFHYVHINLKDIKSFVVKDEGKDSRFYAIQIYLDNKKIKYSISNTNKENLIFLLNLLKSGVKQEI